MTNVVLAVLLSSGVLLANVSESGSWFGASGVGGALDAGSNDPEIAPAASQRPPTLNPRDMDALKAVKPGVMYEVQCERPVANSEDGEREGSKLKYRVVFPVGFALGQPRNLVIMLHPAKLDSAWGFSQYPIGSLGTRDILVSVDGTTILDDGGRMFVPRPQDIIPIRDLVLEIAGSYPSGRILLFGTGDAGRFALAMAAMFPRVIDGAVCHASGMLDRTPTTGGILGVPVAFVHAPGDRLTPYFISADARDAFLDSGHQTVALRRVFSGPGSDGGPAPAGVSDCIDFIVAMSTSKPDEALELAHKLAGVPTKPGDSVSAGKPVARGPVPLGMVRSILRRFASEKQAEEVPEDPTAPKPPGKFDPLRPLTDCTDEQRKQAFELAVKIEQFGLKQVAALRQRVKTKDDLKLTDDATWLGHISAMREDLRGVECVESFIKEVDYDAQLDLQRDPAEVLLSALASDSPVEQVFKTVVEQMPESVLVECLPADLYTRMRGWRDAAGEHSIPAEVVAKFVVVERYYKCKDAGEKAYRKLWEQWTP